MNGNCRQRKDHLPAVLKVVLISLENLVEEAPCEDEQIIGWVSFCKD